MAYNFQKKYNEGIAGESRLDEYFKKFYEIKKVNRQQQRNGIDREFINKETGECFMIEYKSDSRAAKTGNMFVETQSVDGQKMGWIHTSKADMLIYYIPPKKIIYIYELELLRDSVFGLIDKYPLKTIPNEGYDTLGHPIPFGELSPKNTIHLIEDIKIFLPMESIKLKLIKLGQAHLLPGMSTYKIESLCGGKDWEYLNEIEIDLILKMANNPT